MKKFLALALAVIMVLALSVPAWAASITIGSSAETGATDTTEYHYYQLLRASIDGTKVTYYLENTTDDTLRSLLDAVTVGGVDLFTFTQSADGTRWNLTINKKSNGEQFTDEDGAAIAAALNTDAIKAAAISNNTFAQTAAGGSASTGEISQGYYLVTSTLGSKLVVDTLGDVNIATKNEYITNTKAASKTNMNVGDQVEYTITVNIPATAVVGETVTVHDTLDSHLAILDASGAIAATEDDYAITAALEGTPVALSAGIKKAATETFAKSFVITSAMLGKAVVLTYKAELLSTAADDTGYVNEVFSSTPTYETAPSDVDVYTFDFDLDKDFTDGSGTEQATFQLRTTANDESTAISFITDSTGGYVVADSDDTGASTTITATDAVVNIRGLEAGTYYLVELTTASGYNLLTSPVEVTITDTTDPTATPVSPSHTVNGTNTAVKVVNNSGTELPSTGGIGTTIFYVLGGLLVVFAGVLLITKTRMNKEQ